MKIHVLKYNRGDNYNFILANNNLLSTSFMSMDINIFAFNLYPWGCSPPCYEFENIDNFISHHNAKIIATLDVDVDVDVDNNIMNPKDSLLKLKEMIPEEFI